MSTSNKSLVIVESPAKARTIGRFLDDSVTVMASMGHVRDLPTSTLGVDIQDGFTPVYRLTGSGRKVIKSLKQAVQSADDVYLATDPDREGEAIAWHLMESLQECGDAEFHRVTFHEITADAIHESFEHVGDLDDRKVSAQQARRLLDRLVGYKVSPILWQEIRKGTSAGRVQSVALRLLVEREREIQGFEPVEYWNLEAEFQPEGSDATFETRLVKLDGGKVNISNAEEANALAGELEPADYRISDARNKPRKQSAPPPFITSTLQQVAGSRLRFRTGTTMRIAQQLYEGVEQDSEDAGGLITYMRTDSVAIADEAGTKARHFIEQQYGSEFVPAQRNVYQSGENAQEAHEAIRPTDVSRTPQSLVSVLNKQQLRLYDLIWRRFVASQMADARQLDHIIEVKPEGASLTHDYLFRARTRETIFPGYQVLSKSQLPGANSGSSADRKKDQKLPELESGLSCVLTKLEREQCFTKPPPRFSESTLVRELERNGVGRPSTYASTVGTVQQREYVKRSRGKLVPTPLGTSVNDYLVANLSDLFNVEFTADMENELDRIEVGDSGWKSMLNDFYRKLRGWLGEDPSFSIPDAVQVRSFMEIFPVDSIEWDSPVKRGAKTYDDREFFESLKGQADSGSKRLTEKQWLAVLGLAARYSEQIPGLFEEADRIGIRDRLDDLVRREKERAAGVRQDPDPADLKLLDAFSGVDWAPPRKRGRRTFDDRKFYESLRGQVEAGRKLSAAQVRSLKKMLSRYRNQVEDFDELAEEFSIVQPPPPPQQSEEQNDMVPALLGMCEDIKEWAPPRKRGRRVFDDQKFVKSLRQHFEERKRLSVRQGNALRKLVVRYRKHIPDFESRAEEIGLEIPPPPRTIDAKCPECGSPLVIRQGRKNEFCGCSAFPKCRYTTRELPE